MEYNSPEFRKWLDKLQRESWQLELIISGFAIYGLFAAIDGIEINAFKAFTSEQRIQGFSWKIIGIFWYILAFNLILHVLLRGLWIGAIGLRYVSGHIDYQKLNYSEKFTVYLERKVGSFDRYIARLENYCSVLFAVTFLLIFYLLGFFAILFILSGLDSALKQLTFIPESILKPIGIIITSIFTLSALIVFVDFIGQGFLKRKKWTSKIYFPIYWVFSKITFSFLYRPLTYNFLDNKFGKRLIFWMIPAYIVIVILASTYYKNSSYLSNRDKSTAQNANDSNYENESTATFEFINVASIPSKVIQKRYLKIFMAFTEEMEDQIIENNDALKADENTRGYTHPFIERVTVSINDNKVKEAIEANALDEYLKTVNKLYRPRIDSLVYEHDFVVSTNSKNRLGFETYLNIKNLKEGKHILTITGPTKENTADEDSKTVEKTLATIPFWYFPE